MTRVLVAGATGYLGGSVAREMKRRGHVVRALVRRTTDLEVDEVVRGEVTRPETLEGVCDGMDVVFSSVGITRQRDGLTFRDVDYQGNRNLLEEALRAGVKRFIYVSILNGPDLEHLDIVRAHEDFVRDLKASGLEWVVMRPTGFFSDMEEVLNMARRGRVYLFGRGECRVNPIHGADLAVCCADGLEGESREIDVGGPETMTWREIGTIALEAAEKPVKLTSIPVWVMSAIIGVTRLFSRHSAELMAFFTTMATQDVVGPATGSRKLGDHFRGMREGR
jgi:uncharacterized protein YbjT (DUF2867 family)